MYRHSKLFEVKNKDELSIDLTELLTVHTGVKQLQQLATHDAEKKADAVAGKKGKKR